MVNDKVENFFGAEMSYCLLGLRIDKVIIAACFHRFHKCFGDAHAYIEVGDFLVVRFAVYEFKNVRMADAQNAHVGTTSCAPLLYSLCGCIENLHEAYRSAGYSACAPYGCTLLAQS